MTEQEPAGRLVSTWEAVTKDEDGAAHIHTLHKYDYPNEEGTPDFINQAAPTKITPSRRVKPTREDEVTLFLPDSQIPYHDERAVKLAHLAIREIVPDTVVLLGDMVDLPAQSRFAGHPREMGRLQEQLDRYHEMLAQIRSDVPDARIVALTGNHELRLQRAIIDSNAELLGVKRANASEELGVLTLDFLLRTKELDVELIGGYPNGAHWLEDHTVAVHGDIARQNTSSSLEYLKRDPHVSTIHGHTHRAEIQWRTTPTRDGHVQRFAMSPGTLARIDGEVPSYHSTINEHGETVHKAENWQQAVGIVEHNARLANPSLAMIHGDEIRIDRDTFTLD